MAGPNSAPNQATPPPAPPPPRPWERFGAQFGGYYHAGVQAGQAGIQYGLETFNQFGDHVRYTGHTAEDTAHIGGYVYHEWRALRHGVRERQAEEIIDDAAHAGRLAVMAGVEMDNIGLREAIADRTSGGHAGTVIATPGTRLVEHQATELPRGGRRGTRLSLLNATNSTGRMRRESLAQTELATRPDVPLINAAAGREHHHGHRPLWVRIVNQVNIPTPARYNPPTHYHGHRSIFSPLPSQRRAGAMAEALYATTLGQDAYARGGDMAGAGRAQWGPRSFLTLHPLRRRWNQRNVEQVHDLHHIQHEALHEADHTLPPRAPGENEIDRYFQARDHYRAEEEHLAEEVEWRAAVAGERRLTPDGERVALDQGRVSHREVVNFHGGLRTDLARRGLDPDLVNYVQGTTRDPRTGNWRYPTEHYNRLTEVEEYLVRARDRYDRLFAVPEVDPRDRDLSRGEFDALYPDPQENGLYGGRQDADHYPPRPNPRGDIPDPDNGRTHGLTPAQEEQRKFLVDLISELDAERIALNGGPGYDRLFAPGADPRERNAVAAMRAEILRRDAGRREADIARRRVEPTNRERIRHSEHLIEGVRDLNRATAFRLALEDGIDEPRIQTTVNVPGEPEPVPISISPADYQRIRLDGPRNEAEFIYFNDPSIPAGRRIPAGGLNGRRQRLREQRMDPNLHLPGQLEQLRRMENAEQLFADLGLNYLDVYALARAEADHPGTPDTRARRQAVNNQIRAALNPGTGTYTGSFSSRDLEREIITNARYHRQAARLLGFENSAQARTLYYNMVDRNGDPLLPRPSGGPPPDPSVAAGARNARDTRQQAIETASRDVNASITDLQSEVSSGLSRLISGEEAAVLRAPLRGQHAHKRRAQRGVMLPRVRTRLDRDRRDITHFLGEQRTAERIRQARVERPIHQQNERRHQARARNAYGDYHARTIRKRLNNRPILTRDTRRRQWGRRHSWQA